MNRTLISRTGLLILVVTLAVCGTLEAGGRHRNRNCVPTGYTANAQSAYPVYSQPGVYGIAPVQTWPAPMPVSSGYRQSANCNCQQNGSYQSQAYKGFFTTLP